MLCYVMLCFVARDNQNPPSGVCFTDKIGWVGIIRRKYCRNFLSELETIFLGLFVRKVKIV